MASKEHLLGSHVATESLTLRCIVLHSLGFYGCCKRKFKTSEMMHFKYVLAFKINKFCMYCVVVLVFIVMFVLFIH